MVRRYYRSPSPTYTIFMLRAQIWSRSCQMEPVPSSIPDFVDSRQGNDTGDAAEAEGFMHRVDEISVQIDKLEKRVIEIEQFYLARGDAQQNISKASSTLKDKDKEKHITSIRKQQQDSSRREGAAAKRMQELMRQFATIFRQISQHKWAWPFLDPVDVEGLGLHDYYEVIDKPMDFSTIKNKMEAKDGSGYKNVREIYADVRLVFKNAMRYNDEKNDVHVMAKTLLEKFEEKWLQLLPKVAEEEKRKVEEEVEFQFDMQHAQEATYANMARDISNEISEADMNLKGLREMVIQRCRKMSTEEKRKLGIALTRLSPEDLTKALEIVAENNPNFQATAQEVDLDIDAQNEYTLWRLKVFVKDALAIKSKSAVAIDSIDNDNIDDNKKNNSKGRREICDAVVKSAIKRTKKVV
ncbi:transcription factor GTE1-like isoform X1 [Cucurbita pepo subsp. pepo]|uniref:Transcription factor GTE1-like isoform X1 n=4 Tax=Cucurbita TaxID=3660 RepID=A0A6J1EFH0_CUCMO|nr:transcription factor GTE1-like isoform X1 [Cucurbita moschata]XP_023517790.1 transcription factor GTE1-like isoform X1 [Cucurbita pepo subsp. pepo]